MGEHPQGRAVQPEPGENGGGGGKRRAWDAHYACTLPLHKRAAPAAKPAGFVLRQGARPDFVVARSPGIVIRRCANGGRVVASPVRRADAPPPSQDITRERRLRSVRTYTPKPGEVTRQWHVIDATDVVLGRLATPDRDPAARQAQADLRPARRHRRLRRHHQRGQGRPDRRQAGAEEGLPPLGLPGRPARHLLPGAAGQEPREGRREGRPRHAPQELPRPPAAVQAQGLRRRRATRTRRRSRCPSRSHRSRSSAGAAPAALTTTVQKTNEENRG